MWLSCFFFSPFLFFASAYIRMLGEDGREDLSDQPAYLFRVQFQAHTPMSPRSPTCAASVSTRPTVLLSPGSRGEQDPHAQGTPEGRRCCSSSALPLAWARLGLPSASPGWAPPGSPWVGSAVTREGMLLLCPETNPLRLRGFRSCESQEQVGCKITSQCQSMGSQVPPAALRCSQRVQVSRESVSPVQMFWPCPGRWRGRRHCFRPITTSSRRSWRRDISNDSHLCANCLPVSRMPFGITTMCYWVEVSDICWSNNTQQCNYCI